MQSWNHYPEFSLSYPRFKRLEEKIVRVVKQGKVSTISGIARELDLPKEEVQRIIDESDRIQLGS